MYNAFGSNSNSLSVTNSNNDRVAFDNLLRRELKVADPTNALEVADALLKRYKDDRRAQAITLEAQGMPFLGTAPVAQVAPLAPSASDGEWTQAVDDVERDLRELTTSTQLKDFVPELTGWTQAIRGLLAEATTAARFALDPRQRDKTLSLRRQLSDYARLARLVGSLTPTADEDFRQLACSLDEAAAVALVRIGEALADVGFTGSYLLQAPYSELQSRRDAVIYSLRVLLGATQQAYGPNEWPRGLSAYRKLYEALEQQGQGDLRALLVEGELARVMDDVIQRAGNGSADGLRAAGATAEVDLMRFRRLYVLGRNLIRPESPPLTAFLEALQLFADAFTPSGGSRLLRLARPPILFYGIYASQGMTEADRRLLDLVTVRTRLAELLDAFASCDCDDALVQGTLDLCLHSVDRAIDLYASGRDEFGAAECRASAFAYVLLAAEEFLSPETQQASAALLEASEDRASDVEQRIRTKFSDGQRQRAQAEWETVQRRLLLLDASLTLIQPTLDKRSRALREVGVELDKAIQCLAPVAIVSEEDDDDELDTLGHWQSAVRGGFFQPANVHIRSQELCAQLAQEQAWGTLVPGLVQRSSHGGRLVGSDGVLEWLVRRAVVLNENHVGETAETRLPALYVTHECPRGLDIPPHYETLLDGITFDVDRDGRNRL